VHTWSSPYCIRSLALNSRVSDHIWSQVAFQTKVNSVWLQQAPAIKLEPIVSGAADAQLVGGGSYETKYEGSDPRQAP